MKNDMEDRRRLRGQYAPKPGVCRLCSGKVVATIGIRHGPLGPKYGGPPQQHHILGWHCESCQLVYRQRPADLEI